MKLLLNLLNFRITAEVKSSDGFVFCRADGKWNGSVELSYYSVSVLRVSKIYLLITSYPRLNLIFGKNFTWLLIKHSIRHG